MDHASLAQLIRDYVESDETSFVANIDNLIQLGEERLYRLVKMPLQRKVSTSAFNTSDPLLSMPSDFLAVDSISYVSGTTTTFLVPKDLSFLKEAYPTTTTTGPPRFYSIRDNQTIQVGPAPDSTYTVEMAYMKKPTSIVSSTTSWLGDNASVALLYACLVEAYTYLKGEQPILAMYEQRLQEAVGGAKTLGEGRDKKDEWRNPVNRAPT